MPALLKAHRDPCPSLSSLLSHLATARHGLRVLRIIDFSAKVRDLARLCKARGSRLEQLEVGLAGVTSIKLLPQLVAPLAKLKQLHVRVNGVTRKRLGMLLGQGDQVPETLTIDDLVQRLPGDLGWLGINNREWEVSAVEFGYFPAVFTACVR
ncbi:hypothetical protein OE88DRAFT_1656449 [Heliocybe sulcata]|uniref:Uncharacterized protein n=1 Tax=Heliocybe sulcata TaxID=5364 RepID=A0A5C3NH15_9AGAM|nr:hypothetical protein OE88DRAFT_1656449 [Heliocybe sulcata]